MIFIFDIDWSGNPTGEGGTPVLGTDYTIESDPVDKLIARLTFTQAFLDAADKSITSGGDNLSATITLTEPVSGRVFDETYSYSFVTNRIPMPAKSAILMKEATGNPNTGEYILCFKLPNYSSDPNHRDIKKVEIRDAFGTLIDEYDTTIAAGTDKSGDGAVTNNNGKIITGALIHVTGGTLNLGNVTIDGQDVDAQSALVTVSGGTVQLNGGALLQDNRNYISPEPSPASEPSACAQTAPPICGL